MRVMDRSTCPYCNGLISLSAAEGKVRCPRCGATLPARFLAGLSPSPPAGPAPSDNGDRRRLHPRRSWSNRWVAAAFVILMAGMAVVGLALALGSLKSRKTRDPKVP